MKTIAEQFEDYRANVIPQAASDVQVTESCHAFHAGAAVALVLASEGVPLSTLTAELEAYTQRLMAQIGQAPS